MVADRERRLDAVESRLEIGQLPIRYALAVDGRDVDTWVRLFVPDVHVGRDEFGGEWLFRRRRERHWYAADIAEHPQAVGFDSWGTNRPPALPDAFPTWGPFWAAGPDRSG